MYLEQVNEDQLKKIYEEFNVTEKTVEQDIKTLMQWLEQQPHLPNIKDENFLRIYLLRCKISLEKTKHTLEMYFVFKAQIPELFKNRNPTSVEVEKFYDKVGQIFITPKLTPELNRVVFYRIHKNCEAIGIDEYARAMMTILSLSSFISGIYRKVIIVLDFEHFTTSMLPMVISNYQKLHSLIFEHTPLRVEAIYVLKSSILMDQILAFGRKLSKKIFQERVTIWKKDRKDLAEVIPKECLPIEYGGNAGNWDELTELYRKETESWKGWLDEENENVADLSKLPEEKKVKLDMGEFGMEGSFRKLDLE